MSKKIKDNKSKLQLIHLLSNPQVNIINGSIANQVENYSFFGDYLPNITNAGTATITIEIIFKK
jgi:hypothetical protein